MEELRLAVEAWIKVGVAAIGGLMMFLVPWWNVRKESQIYRQQAQPDHKSVALSVAGAITSEPLAREHIDAQRHIALALDKIAECETARLGHERDIDESRSRLLRDLVDETIKLRRTVEELIGRIPHERT